MKFDFRHIVTVTSICLLFLSAGAHAQTTTLVEPVATASQSNVVFTDIGGGNVQVTFNGVFDFSSIGGGAESYSATFSYDTSVPPFATPPSPDVGIAFYALDPADFNMFGGAVTPTLVTILIQDGAGVFNDFFTLTVLFSGPGLPIPNTSQTLLAVGLNAGAFPGTMFSSVAFPTNLDVVASALGAGAPTAFSEVSFTVDGTVTPTTESTVIDQVIGTTAQVTFPAGIVAEVTQVGIDVLDSPLPVPMPTGFVGPGTRFVSINLSPQPTFPLPSPGLTVVLPLLSAMPPGDEVKLFRFNLATAALVPALDNTGQPIVGTVDSGGLSATFNGVARLSTVVGLVPVAVPFSALSAGVRIERRGREFEMQGKFTLGADSDGIDPTSENVRVQLGSYAASIPIGFFRANRWRTRFQFHGVIDGVKLKIRIDWLKEKRFEYVVEGERAQLNSLTSPVGVGLLIGDDGGSVDVKARLKKK